jgi:HEAT repeat protein
MVSTPSSPEKAGFGYQFLRWINLREGEGNRTFLMFAFYASTSSGLVWLEACSVDLFLGEFGAANLPFIYIVSSAIKIGLGLLYSWMQRFLPLRWVIVIIALLIAAPLPLFWAGLGRNTAATEIVGITLLQATILLMQLWLEASHALNELNASITANQLFNIREVKRTYPLISSGILVADVVSGFSLPLVLNLFPKGEGVPMVILCCFGLMVIGALILLFLCQTHQQSFPEVRRRRDREERQEAGMPRIRGELRRYTTVLQIFFALGQVFLLLVEFQFLSQLGQHAQIAVDGNSGDVASFLGVFNGALGICELAMQWLFSSRVIDRMGAFSAVMLLPAVVILISGVSMTGMIPIFFGVLGLRFLYELLHYTLFSGVGPFLFYSLPEHLRNREQARVRGIAEPIANTATGLALFGLVQLGLKETGTTGQQFFFGLMIVLAGGWLFTIFLLRQQYVGLLVLNAERGQLSSSDIDLRALRQSVIEKLEKPGSEADKKSCIELLNQIDPKNASEVLTPLLHKLPTALQEKSLEVMLHYPNQAYFPVIKALFDAKPAPEVMALSLRYLWLTEPANRIEELRAFLRPETHAIVRGTAAALILRQGNPKQKAEATNTLRQMLTHPQKQERIMGCRALGDALYLQALRLFIPDLLRDRSLSVRRAVLEAIGSTRLEEYYPSLLKGLHYKSTREAAKKALVRLDNDALPMLVSLADDIHLSDLVRGEALSAIGQIGSLEAIDLLIARFQTAWGNQRRNLLRILLKIPQERGIEAVLDRLGRRGIEQLIDQELMLIAQVYAAIADLILDRVPGEAADFLRCALVNLPSDAIERIFGLMKFLYPISAIQAAAFNLQSGTRTNIAQGVEILDNTLDISQKRAFLALFDHTLLTDKLQSLSELVPYTPMSPEERVKILLDLRHFLSDWSLACCFHVARQAEWRLANDQIQAALNHPRGFVREAALGYLEVASPQRLGKLLPRFRRDRDPLVAKQVEHWMKEMATERVIPSDKDDMPTVPNLRVL